MKYFSRLVATRQSSTARLLAAVACGALGALAPLAFASDSSVQIISVIDESPALMMHNSPGYLGVTLQDINTGRAGELRLKDTRGAEIVLLDHDAPACKAGIKLHDVILQINGQAVENVDQLRRLLHEIPVGRTVSLVIFREGQQSTVSVELGDRAKLERQPFVSPYSVPEPEEDQRVETWVPPVSQQQERGRGSNTFIGPISVSPFYVGVIVDPVGAQLAGYFGVKNGTGLLVKSVDENSPASEAGMKAGDVVLRVNGKTMVSGNDWLHEIRENRGKPIQVVVIRNRAEQTITMWAGTPKHKG